MNGTTRPPLERMGRILALLKEGCEVTCSSVGRELEVCSKTIQRDFDFMRDRLQVPLGYDAKTGTWKLERGRESLGLLR